MIGPDYELQAVFFDLDGTLVDSAPDLIVAMQRLRAELGETAVDVTAIGEVVSKGGRAMLRRGFPDADDARIDVLLPRFLDLYAEAIATHTRLYDGMDDVLRAIESGGLRWGVVTHKPRRLLAGVTAQRSVYVGDDMRDIEAGQRAGMKTIAAGWGYLNGEDPHAWQADSVAMSPGELPRVLGLD